MKSLWLLLDPGIVIKNVLLVPWALVSWMIEQIFISTKMIILISMTSTIQRVEIYTNFMLKGDYILCIRILFCG